MSELENDVKPVVKAIRRSNAEMLINLCYRRKWYDDSKKTEDTTEDTTQEKQPENVQPDGKKGEQNKGLFTQEHMDYVVEGRLARQKSELINKMLGDYAVTDTNELQSKLAELKQADVAKAAADEANKTELQKLQEQLDAANVLQVATLERNKALQIQNAIKDIAPAKEVPANHFDALIKLMVMTEITIAEGIVDAASVEKAIDTTLEANPFLKAATDSKPNGFGSPVRTKKPPVNVNAQQPVKRHRKTSL